jgi:DNA-directed RNA polymerase specialized sigma24 family protein
MDFPPTVWTLINKASLNGDTVARGALETFCEQYRGPVIAYLRSRGISENRVEDLAHDFLLNFMVMDFAKRADRAKGRFRSYLLGALKKFMISDLRALTRQKSGGGAEQLSLDAPGVAEVIADPSEEEIREHDRNWAVNLLRLSFGLLEREMLDRGRRDALPFLKPFLLPTGEDPPPYAVLAQQLNSTEDAARAEVSRLRKRFRVIFKEEVARTLDGPEEVEEEIAYLTRALRMPGGVPTA